MPSLELSYLGALLTHTEAREECTLTPDDFESPMHANLFERIMERHTLGLGVSQGLLTDDYPEHSSAIWASTDHLAEVALYEATERTLREASTRRRLNLAAQKIVTLAKTAPLESLVDSCRAEVDAALRGDGPKVVSMRDDVAAVLTEYRKDVTVVPSPWTELNRCIGGFAGGRLYIVAARPGIGKSAVAAQIAYELALTGPVVFATMEMSKGELYSRIVSQQAGIYYGGMAKELPESLKAKEAAWLREHVRDLRVLDSGTQTLGTIRQAARSASRDGNLSGVVVDYLHLLDGPGDNEAARISNITRGLKQLSMDLKVPVIALSQLNRDITKRPDGRPNLGDLRGSGGIEQDGDSVIFLYRDPNAPEGELSVHIGKNRQGPSFVNFTLEWQGDFVRAVDAPQWGV